MSTKKPKTVDNPTEGVVENTEVEKPAFSKQEWQFIAQCVAESTVKVKDSGSAANILAKLIEHCK